VPIAKFPPGTAYNLPLQINQMDGTTPSTAYLSTDTLSTQLWTGDDQQLITTPVASWNLSIGVPAFTVGFQASDTAGLAPGTYRLIVNITRASTTFEAYRDSIELTWLPQVFVRAQVTANLTGGVITSFTVNSGGAGYPPSSTTIPVTITGGFGYGAIAQATSDATGAIAAVNLVGPPPPGATIGGVAYRFPPTVTVGTPPIMTYCTLKDMQSQCTWIQQYMDQDNDQTGFLEQRGLARNWFDRLLLASWPGARVTYIQEGWPSNYGQFTLISNPWLVAGLQQGFLMVPPLYQTQRGYEVAEVNATYAIALVLRSQMGPASGIDKYAGYWMRRAIAAASQCTAELDINGDGMADIAIPLSVTNTRRG
jgi:hypothetical protein